MCLYASSIYFLGTSGHFISRGFSFLRVCESVERLGSSLNILLYRGTKFLLVGASLEDSVVGGDSKIR